jgi:hypothetical protein
MEKTAVIDQDSNGKYYVRGEPGKKFDSYEGAKKRLNQIEMFKHMKGKKRKSFMEIVARVAGIVPVSGKAPGKDEMNLALKQAAEKDPRLASMLGCDPCGQKCPVCGAIMVYDDGRDAHACPCGYSEPNGPALVSFDE